MNQSNLDTLPSSPTANLRAEPEMATHRKNLIPLWIKIFGWVFIVIGISVPPLTIFLSVTNQHATFEMFGLRHYGSPFHPMALLISAIVLSLAISAYGLLFGKPWGLDACLVTGYVGVAICLATMAYSFMFQRSLTIRLELLVQIPYLIKLRKIKPFWMSGDQGAA